MASIDAKLSQVSPYSFDVQVRDFEPMSGSRGKGKRLAKKQELAKKIVSAKTISEIEMARTRLYGKHVVVRILFYLWKGGAGHSETSAKKDLDNLLKLVLDALQPFADSNHTVNGINVIRSDDDVFRVEASKRIVAERHDVGLDLQISEFVDSADKAVPYRIVQT